jgi:hypothetical protein
MSEHTKTPWCITGKVTKCEIGGHTVIVDPFRKLPVAYVPFEHDAAFITHAVNSHTELVESLKGLLAIVNAIEYPLGPIQQKLYAKARAALANAEGRTV